ncbi:oligosaccharide flippase family protein [Paenibacillus sp. DYY-L-2]|uniref:oligosaccharide flippase family protein n=1 Tax=Paenibacillus sp. DYY-L-2 TaxID=3447013 RepID=UPI003F4F4EEA
MKKPHLLLQSAMRAGAMTMVKLLGLISRIILARLVGAEGIGLYQMGYSLYGFVIMLFGGLPTTLAIITAKKPGQGWKLLKILSFGVALIAGILSQIVFWESPRIAVFLGNPDLHGALKSIAPAIFAAPLLGLLRGYLQGLERFGIIAGSEVIEQASRVFIMLLVIYYCLPSGLGIIIGKGLYATFLSIIISFLVLILYISRHGLYSSGPQQDNLSLSIKWVLRTSLIISFTRLLVPASEFIDAILIPNRLITAGYSPTEATSIFGIITGMAATVAYTPTLITGALSHTLTMRIASQWQRKEEGKFRELLRIAMKLSWLWGLISASFLFVYAQELSFYIFHTDKAGELIKFLSAIPLLVGLREMTTSILWAQDIKKIPFLGLITGICLSAIIQYFVIAIPGYAYVGAAAGILSLEIVSLVLNLTVFQRNLSLIKILPSALLDIAVIGGGIAVVARIKPDSLISLPEFLFSGIFFFSLAGLYMILRCRDFGKLSLN